jgi:hypothetical protein
MKLLLLSILLCKLHAGDIEGMHNSLWLPSEANRPWHHSGMALCGLTQTSLKEETCPETFLNIVLDLLNQK